VPATLGHGIEARGHPVNVTVDDLVIGSGQAGGPLAGALAGAGRRVVLIEGEHVGGTCINEGCTPTKTMVASARVAHLARRAEDYGVDVGPVRVDLARVRERKRAMVESFRGGSERALEKREGLELVRGDARFLGPREIGVRLCGGGERRLRAERVFINAGTRARVPALEGLERVPYVTNASLMELSEVPEHLLVLGGGYIGVEFAQMFRRFGSEVSVVQHAPHLLDREDEDVSRAVEDILREDGVELWLGSEATRAEAADRGGVALHVATPEGERSLRGSHLLVATGRVPNTDALDVAAAGLETDAHGFLRVDARLHTNVEGVYALGDVKGGPAFTHIAYDDYRIVRDEVLGGGAGRGTNERLVPYTVFLDPQLGRVGLSERDARALGREVRVARLPMTSVARALETDETRGFIKALVDPQDRRILGAAVLAVEGGEVMTVLQMAMMGGLPYTAVRDAAIAHPLLSESLNNLFASLD
jgi:pyruvate/2-oxoglutarate dehydrogenase complex dihydrolipoamide dehydrogenase (E3) component